MQYMLMICVDDTFEPSEQIDAESDAWVERMRSRGIRLSGDRLSRPSDATTVRVRGDEVVLADGPFAETKEQMAGYDLIECRDLDEALHVAAEHPVARFGSVEVRPIKSE